MASSISFSFPGWGFEGKEQRTTAAPAAYDWLEDLDELEEAEESSTAPDAGHETVVAAGTGAGDNWLGSAEWPDDIAHAVLSHLDCVRALSDARACCLHWKRIATNSDLLWERLWEANPRFCARPARQPCGTVFRLPGVAQPTAFLRYLTRARARKLYEWVDLQEGWTRLELLLTPEAVQEAPPVLGPLTRRWRALAAATAVTASSTDPLSLCSPRWTPTWTA